MRPSRTARRMVSSQTPFSRAASWMSISSSSWAAAAVISFLRRATRAAAACSAPLSRSVSVSRCASRTKAASQGGRSSGRSKTDGASAILHPVLLPNAFAGLGRHRPVLVVQAESDLLQVFLLAALPVPVAEQFGAVLASAESLPDHLDVALLRLETAEVGPDVAFVVQFAPQLDDACARSIAVEDHVDFVREVPEGPRRLRFGGFRLHFVLHALVKSARNAARTPVE